ncbi:hypothetical protein [Halomonas sp. NO4]|uniref:hypothetical protein n=1 Tax=Halomonas sp. NO4 TaxID=2484813 RepID=UPI0013D71F90|nr:hypothetical protein [Halomonas sp. NO4]
MTTEPQRLQYLEAMGLTAWVPRYRLPNARQSAACEWAPSSPEPSAPPTVRLHALLDEAERAAQQRPATPPQESEPASPAAAAPGRARQLLEPARDASEVASPASGSVGDAVVEASSEPLRFSVQVACLDGRWLVLLPGARPPGAVELRLLANLFRAAGISLGQAPDFQAFDWPLEKGLPVASPEEEAKAGLQAFIEGAGRRGWAPERVLLFGRDDTLERLLGVTDERCTLLDLPGWRGPALDELAGSAEAKRALWPRLAGWRAAWYGEGSDASVPG